MEKRIDEFTDCGYNTKHRLKPVTRFEVADVNNVTINDIARESGVSKATVSRVINHSLKVDPTTRERVLEVIRKRHY